MTSRKWGLRVITMNEISTRSVEILFGFVKCQRSREFDGGG